MDRPYTVFGVHADAHDERVTVFVEANSPEDAEKRAIRDTPDPIIVASVVEGRVLSAGKPDISNVTKIRGRGFVTEVSMVHVSQHSARLPLRCPQCKADFRAANALETIGLEGMSYLARMPRGEDNEALAVNHDSGGRVSHDTDIPVVILNCNKCKFTVWDGYHQAT